MEAAKPRLMDGNTLTAAMIRQRPAMTGTGHAIHCAARVLEAYGIGRVRNDVGEGGTQSSATGAMSVIDVFEKTRAWRWLGRFWQMLLTKRPTYPLLVLATIRIGSSIEQIIQMDVINATL